ncbi:hypothetical protein Chor_015310 [Crotalus horridus]
MDRDEGPEASPGGAAEVGEPPVSDPKDPEEPRMQKPPGSPLVLPHTLQELLSKDIVQVQLIPEKKGLFLKHVEYEVSSKGDSNSGNEGEGKASRVLHHLAFQEDLLLQDVAIVVSDREFIETRRRALKRFINLVARHPPFSEDVLLKFFLSFSGSDVQNKLRELVQGVGDEFMNCQFAMQAKAWQGLHGYTHTPSSGSALGSDTTPLPSWAALNSSAWGNLKQALKGLSVEFAMLADKAVQQGKQEENDVVEKLNLFLDLLQSYKDLCERHENGVLHKHQRALHKYSMMKKQMMSATVQNKEPDSVEQLESRIVEQENAILTMEQRNYFSLYCLHQETQLIHIYLPLTSHILGAFVNSQIQGHKEMSTVWNELKPKLSCLFAGTSSVLMLPLSAQEENFLPS